MSKYIAMNRFKVAEGHEEAFEEVWRNRDSTLHEVPGFIEFKLLRGPRNAEEGYTLYSSHAIWESEDHFRAWTQSEHFRNAHKNAGQRKVMYKGGPNFEGFTVVLGN